jgi:cytochrome c oxidase subunit 2
MKILLKIFTLAAAAGMVPAAAAAQQAPAQAQPQAAQQQAAPATTPTEVAEPTGRAAPAVPGAPSTGADAGSPATPASGGEEPSDATVANASTFVSPNRAERSVGQPDGRFNLQDQFSPIGVEGAWFHNVILLPAITIISLFVLILLAWVIVRYRRAAHPVPSRTTHNTVLEVVWTLVPVLILVVIALPSIRLLANQYSPPAADLTVKAIGNQWYWEYEYPDHGVQFVSNMLPDAEAARRGEPRLLAVDNRIVVPQGATVKMIITSNDVIHSFGVPSLWLKLDAVPGRLNETWFRAERPGIYYGACYELCGARHPYMPIAIEVVTPAQFAAWVASRGGAMPGARPAAAPAATRPAQAGATAGDATPTNPAPEGVVNGTTQAPVSTQGATESRRGSN